MPKSIPFLYLRGRTFAFRIAVPLDLRSHLKQREIVRSLSTLDHQIATPLALEFGAAAKRYFYDLRCCLSNHDNSKLLSLLKDWKHKFEIGELRDQHLDELIQQKIVFEREIEKARLEAKVEALEGAMADVRKLVVHTPAEAPQISPMTVGVSSAPMLGVVVDIFLERYAQTDNESMLRKHVQVLPMLLEIIGDRPVDQLRQAHINEFFDIVCNLPPHWKVQCRKQKLTVRQLAELDHEKTLAPKSFEDTYIASVRPFLIAAKKDWQDQGFPLGLTTDGIEYLGDRDEGENKQRSFTIDELQRLFQGEAMRSIASSSGEAHRYWLPHIGLFTGARVNEICQINPQLDILKDEQSGCWYFWINEETEADGRIKKSVKTGDARKIPIHQVLIDLGLLEYVKQIKDSGAKLLFPAWEPINKRASGNAEKWFRQFLRDTKLRDETPKRKILGMHAFRSTLLTHGLLQTPKLNLTPISGHAQNPEGIDGVAKGYLDMELIDTLTDLKVLIDQLEFNVDFYRPTSPAGAISSTQKEL